MKDIDLKMIFDGYNSMSTKVDRMVEKIDIIRQVIDLHRERLEYLEKVENENVDVFNLLRDEFDSLKQEFQEEEEDENPRTFDDDVLKIVKETGKDYSLKSSAINSFSDAIYTLCFDLNFSVHNFDVLMDMLSRKYLEYCNSKNEVKKGS